jgi:hypothetical protein
MEDSASRGNWLKRVAWVATMGMLVGVLLMPLAAFGRNSKGPPNSPPAHGRDSNGPPISPPVGPPLSPPVGPPLSPPVGPPLSPPVGPPLSPPVGPPLSPPIGPPLSPPVGPPDGFYDFSNPSRTGSRGAMSGSGLRGRSTGVPIRVSGHLETSSIGSE